MKTKSTKRALIASFLALCMCFTMLIGTTFAWFTDSVTSGGNMIQTGTLDVSMGWAEAKEDPSTVTYTDASAGAIFKSDLWEPGFVEARHIKISNEGTLALKYKLLVVANGEVSDRADVIDVYYYDPAQKLATDSSDLVDAKKIGTLTDVLANFETTAAGTLEAGKNHTVTIALKMQESAGNEYQNLAIGTDFSIVLVATQATSEDDSFGNQYDMDAWSDVAEPPVADAEGAVEVWTAAQLAGVMGAMNGIKTINIMENIDLAGRTWNSANFWGTGTKTINGNGHTISNMTVNGDGKLGFIGTNSGDITVNDLTFKNANVASTGSFVGVVIGYAYGNITLNNVDVIDSEVSASIAKIGIRAGGLIGFVPPDGGSVALKDCDVSGSTISGYHNVGAMVGTTMTEKAVTVENCTAKNNTLLHAGSNIGAFAFGAGDSGYIEYVPASGFTAENNTVICRVYTDSQLAAAIKSPALDVITVAPGEYGVIDVSTAGRKLTIVPQDGATVKFAGINGQSNNNNASDITIKGITSVNSLATEGWYTGTAQKIKPCVGVWGGNYTFEDCTFNVVGTSGAETGVMSWWTTNAGTMTFKNCTFNGGSSSARAMQIYGNYDLNVEDCTFNTEKDYAIKYVGAEGCKATLTGNKVYNTVNFVQAGSGAYPGKNYSIEFKNNILADGINSIYVDNDENQTIIIDGKKYVYNAASLAKAVAAEENATVVLGSGNFGKLSAIANGVTIIGNGETTFEADDNVLPATLNNVTFKGVNLSGYNVLQGGIANGNVTFEDCVISGDNYGIHFDSGNGVNKIVFRRCKITGFTTFAATIESVVFEDCEFINEAADASGATQVNIWGGEATFKKCHFDEFFWMIYVCKDATINIDEVTYDGEINDFFYQKSSANVTWNFVGTEYTVTKY